MFYDCRCMDSQMCIQTSSQSGYYYSKPWMEENKLSLCSLLCFAVSGVSLIVLTVEIRIIHILTEKNEKFLHVYVTNSTHLVDFFLMKLT